jgi:hypothetical protein
LIAPVFRDLKHSGRQRGRARQGRLVGERRTMIDREHELPIAKQAAELGISRGSDLVSGDGDVRTFNPPSDTRY